MKHLILLSFLLLLIISPAWPLTSKDAYVIRKGDAWTLGTGKVERTIKLAEGRVFTTSWKDKTSGRELLPKGAVSDELAAVVNGQPVLGGSGGWSLVDAQERMLAQGEIQLDLTLRRDSLEVTKSYIVYPGSSIIREWARFKNAGTAPLRVVEPGFLNLTTKPGPPESVDFHWMTGGENKPGSWALKTEKLGAGKTREFDSYDPFGDPPLPGAGRSFRMGSGTYAPWNAVMSRETGEGVFIGWDYFGHWASRFTLIENGAVNARFRVAGYDKTLQPGESLTTPRAFVGLFQKDLDEAGNECLDWQYAYLWDYTRAGWFPAIRMLGWWWKGTPWKDPNNTWYGGNGDAASAFRKVFRLADVMHEVGADVYHRDWGWWDHAGDWDGPDFKTMGAYLHKYGMGELIYAFIYTVDPKSKVAREHPDWVASGTLDMSKPEVVEYLKRQLDDFRERFGPFEWRNDSTPTVPIGGDTPLLGQDQGFREILRSFLDKHPDCAFQAVNGGGNNAGYDYARYASTVSFSDGAVGILRNQWASLLLPPDKTSDIPDIWQPGQYDKAIWRGLLTINFDMTGDTWDPKKLEGIRELIDIYHYLGSQGVVGRWVHVYRPQVAGDEPTMYFERLSRDGKRGIIIPKRTAMGSVTIRPRGLNSSESYLVSFQESRASETRTGADLMANGIKIEKMEPGELIYLNLPYHPGNTLDKVPPTPPSGLRKAVAENMGYPGVELTWKRGHDDHWLSYYEVFRNHQMVDKVAKGTFYFDHSAGADIAAMYQVRSVDGAGLRSGAATAAGSGGKPALIFDDAQTALSFAGKWERETGLQPAYAGTISRSDETSASFSFGFEGTKFTWFTKLGDDCGKAEVSIDGQREAVVDTYSADDIWGVGIYSKTFPAAGKHTVKISVLGEHGGPRGNGAYVYVDGVRIEGRE
jgi:hypothetical protein